MAPRSSKQNEQIKKKKESLIIETALSCFSKEGYNTTSMQTIAKEAGISKGNLYNYFLSKEDLLEAVLRFGLDQFSEFYVQLGTNVLTQEKFEKAIRQNFEMVKSNKLFWKLYFTLVTQPVAQVLFSQIVAPFLEEYITVFETYFKSKGDKNSATTALLLGSSMDGISMGYIMMGDFYPIDEVVEELIRKFK